MHQAWIGLAGAVIGAAASIITTLLVQRTERHRRAEERAEAERTRFHQERLGFYVEFDVALGHLLTHHYSVQSGLPPDPERFTVLLLDLTAAHSRLSFVATQTVAVEAADLLSLVAVAEGSVDVKTFEKMLGEFKSMAREELGVNPSGDE